MLPSARAFSIFNTAQPALPVPYVRRPSARPGVSTHLLAQRTQRGLQVPLQRVRLVLHRRLHRGHRKSGTCSKPLMLPVLGSASELIRSSTMQHRATPCNQIDKWVHGQAQNSRAPAYVPCKPLLTRLHVRPGRHDRAGLVGARHVHTEGHLALVVGIQRPHHTCRPTGVAS